MTEKEAIEYVRAKAVAGWSDNRLSREIGPSRSTMKRVRQGKPVSPGTVDRIAAHASPALDATRQRVLALLEEAEAVHPEGKGMLQFAEDVHRLSKEHAEKAKRFPGQTFGTSGIVPIARRWNDRAA